jgi:hypothetical protein
LDGEEMTRRKVKDSDLLFSVGWENRVRHTPTWLPAEFNPQPIIERRAQRIGSRSGRVS